MTMYARRMAHKAQDGWLNGPGGHAHALEVVEAVVAEVIERCAQEADDAPGRSVAVAARIRALAASPALQPAPVATEPECVCHRVEGGVDPWCPFHGAANLAALARAAAPQLSVPAEPRGETNRQAQGRIAKELDAMGSIPETQESTCGRTISYPVRCGLGPGHAGKCLPRFAKLPVPPAAPPAGTGGR